MITLSDLDLDKKSIEEIGELLIEAKKAYYTGGRPIMDDHTYDTLEDILRQKAPHHRLFSKVGTPNFDTGWEKKKHTLPMSSQNKVNLYPDLVHYFELKKIPIDTQFVVQPKCDGLSLEIEYKDGKLVDAVTRGNGQVGDVITQNVVKMKNFVFNPDKFTGSVRCEIVVRTADFKKLNEISEEKYSNPRNAASGLSQRLDSKYSEFCSLMAVDIFPAKGTELEKVELLKQLGFTPVETSCCPELSQVEEIYQEFLLKKRETYPFEIDGLVIKINDLKIAGDLGYKDNRPKFQVAYKFPAMSNQTQIKSVAWQVGPLGSITPVAQVEPIELSGAIITFASLSNYDLVKKMDLNIGDIVEISRRGDVIPHIEKVVTKVNPGHIDIPGVCPACHTKLLVEDKFLRCPNAAGCLPQIIGSLNIFCATLDILGLSEKTIAKLYHAGKVQTPGDFFCLTADDIKNLDNLGEKSAANIIHQIQRKKELTLKQVFDAAVIPNFSAARIQQLIDAGFSTPDKLLNVSVDQLLQIKGFQTVLAQKIVDGLALRRRWIESLLQNVKVTDIGVVRSGKLSGLNFCITGELSKPRPEVAALIESEGGKVQSAVSKNTSYLLTNETDSGSSKFVTAQKLGVKIISEDQFNRLLG